MDVSPSRQPGTFRRDNSKTIPKFSGEQIFKQKAEAKAQAEKSTETTKVSIATPAPTPAPSNSKIPMKRTPISNLPAKTTPNPRSIFQKQQMKSASKISLTIKELGGKKLEKNPSKLSFKGTPSNSSRETSGKAPSSKSLSSSRGTSGPGISRRSASTVSCRSSRTDRQQYQQQQQQLHQQQQQKNSTADIINIPPLGKVTSTAGDHDHNLSARERVAENNKIKVFEALQKKLLEMQTDFMKKFDNLKGTTPEKLKADYKFITMIRNDECKLIIKDEDLVKMPRKLPVESVKDFKEKIKFAMDSCLMLLMENLRNAQSITNDYERSLNLEETHNKLEREQAQKLRELYEYINELLSMKEGDSDTQIVKMQKEIQEGKKLSLLAEKKLMDLKKCHAEELLNKEMNLKEKSDAEVIKRDIQIAELQKKLKIIEKQYEKVCSTRRSEDGGCDVEEKAKLMEELRISKDNVQNLNKQLAAAEKQLKHERSDKQGKVDSMGNLEADLEAARNKIEELRAKNKSETTQKMQEHYNEITKLRTAVDDLEKDNQELENQMEKMKMECFDLVEVHNKLKDAEDHIAELQNEIDERKGLEEKSELPKEIQIELSKFRQSEVEKRREIEKLKVELSKAHFNICQLEEQIQRDQQLLEVRSELINSLQTNDNSQRIHLEEMFAQVGDKNNTINELNNELRTKSEEFRNLFTTLSTKQMELSRQEHMIKLLEESNERSQMLRVKQEEKIGRMEEEIAHLKQTIAIYQTNVISQSGCKNLMFAPVTPTDEYNENFYYYTSERRRKRQVDINVKKYET